MKTELEEAIEDALEEARDKAIDNIIRAVAELPYRESPDYWPEAMLVTAEELEAIILEHSFIFESPPTEHLSTWLDANNPPSTKSNESWMVTDGQEIYFHFYWLKEFTMPEGKHYPTGWYSAQDVEPTTLNITHYKAMPRLPKE